MDGLPEQVGSPRDPMLFMDAEREARCVREELCEHGDALPAGDAPAIEETCGRIDAAWFGGVDESGLQALVAELHTAAEALMLIAAEAKAARSEAAWRAAAANPNTVLAGFGTDFRVMQTATATLHSLQRAGRWPVARPAQITRPMARVAPRRGPSRAVRGTRRVRAARSTSRSPGSKSEPEPPSRRPRSGRCEVVSGGGAR